MGKRGVAPAPTALKIVRGDRPSRVNQAEPKPDDRRCPAPPSWMPGEGKALWRRLAPDLHRKGVLTWWDRDEFAVWVEAIVIHRWASQKITPSTILVKGAKNPAIQVQRDAAQTILSFGSRFGLSASDRQTLTIPGEAEPDDARRLLS